MRVGLRFMAQRTAATNTRAIMFARVLVAAVLVNMFARVVASVHRRREGFLNTRSACWRGMYLVQLQRMLIKRSRAAVLQSWWKGWGVCVWWEGALCRSGEDMWNSAGNETVEWHV